MSADSPSLTDVGPAIAPPSWCLPDAEPRWNLVPERFGGCPVCIWSRDVPGGVRIVCEDHVIDGRVMRTEPRILHRELPRDGWTCEQARQLVDALAAAADLVTCAVLDEAARGARNLGRAIHRLPPRSGIWRSMMTGSARRCWRRYDLEWR